MESKITYINGIDQDSAVNKRIEGTYLKAKNIRIVTEGGISTGSIENEKGTNLSFNIPDIPELTLENGVIIPAQTNLMIIGITTMVDDIIVFTTNSSSATPNSYGQIWKLKYNEETNTIIGILPGNTLDVTFHLYYNNLINFSSFYQIKSVARYENTNIQRVYWTDNYNPVRSLNIANRNISINTAINLLDLDTGVNFTQPNNTLIGVGNLRTGCKIQFSYRLLSTNGSETLYAPVSPYVSLVESSYDTGTFQDFSGSGSAIIKNKSVTYTLTGLDTSYYSIENIAIVTDENGVKTVYKFSENLLPSSGALTIICSDLDTAVEIPYTEFNMLSSGFNVAKDIETYKNRLVAANLKSRNRKLNIDSRAYRFNAAGEALLKSILGDITLTSPTPDYDSVPENHDAINIYNKESDSLWYTNNQYKYQEDGVTLGGSGKYISYSFVTRRILANASFILNEVTNAPPHLSVNRENNGLLDFNVNEPTGTNRYVFKNNQFRNSASSWVNDQLGGYARGETYRFGLVGYKKGTVTFVNWIGDIRFPDVEDGFPLQEVVAGQTYLNQLGINFTVNLTSISNDIDSYAIVRLERDINNETKVSSGMMMFCNVQNTADDTTLWRGTSYPMASDANINGTPIGSIFHLGDKPGFLSSQMAQGGAKLVGYLLSDLGQTYEASYKPGDYIRTRGYYSAVPVMHHLDTATKRSFSYKTRDFVNNDNFELFEIDKSIIAETGEYFPPSGSFLDGDLGVNSLINASYSSAGSDTANNKVPLGMGSKKFMFLLKSASTLPHFSGNPGDASGNSGNLQWYGSGDYGTTTPYIVGDPSYPTVYFKEVVYARYLNNQYGGNTFVARSNNQYISCNHFQNCINPSELIKSFEVWGGDTYVNYYDDEYLHQYQVENFENTYKVPGDFRVAVTVCFPVESRINSDLQVNSNWAKRRDMFNIGAYEKTVRNMYNVWNFPNNTEQKFFSYDFLSTLQDEHPHMIWASETKLDGEFVDSWRSFKVANSIEVEGVFGPINRLISFKESLLFYQDSAVGTASVEEKSVIQDTSGVSLVLGTGTVLPNYSYISRKTGCFHQHAVIASNSSIYHFDTRLRKIFRINGIDLSLSDSKGISSSLDNDLSGKILNTDKNVYNVEPTGVHGVFDSRYNRVLFTFINCSKANPYTNYIYELNGLVYLNIPAGEYIDYLGTTYYVPLGYQGLASEITPKDFYAYPKSFTISYDEVFQCFRSYYDFVPGLYLEYGRRLIAGSPFNREQAFVHNVGTHCSYYGLPPVPHGITLLVAPNPEIIKILNNVWWTSQVIESNGSVSVTKTINNLNIYNDYQTTGNQTLINEVNVKRRMRIWRYTVPRDINSNNKARLRNNFFIVEVSFNNANDTRYLLQDMIFSFTLSQH